MPEHEIPLILITQRLDGDVCVGEALHFPEVLALHARADRVGAALRSLAKEILARSKVSQRLLDLAQFARVESVSVERETITAEVRTPVQIAAEDSKEREQKRAVIEEAGVVLSDDGAEAAYEIDGLVKQLAEALA